MAKRISQSLLWLIAAAASADIVIEDFAGPVDAFFLDVRVDKAAAFRTFELGLRHCAAHCANDGACAYFATDPRRNPAVGAYPSCYLSFQCVFQREN